MTLFHQVVVRTPGAHITENDEKDLRILLGMHASLSRRCFVGFGQLSLLGSGKSYDRYEGGKLYSRPSRTAHLADDSRCPVMPLVLMLVLTSKTAGSWKSSLSK